ncbi:MAG: SCO7613 C-terminal domain-containing membrane protein, partial [Actinomycetota bacterium]
VRWDEIPDAAKLGALVAATGACLLAGRALRPTLPASAGALVHLGAFLVPVDVAAIGVRADLDWSTMLLTQGLVTTVTFAWAARAERSVVLRWAAATSVVALAGGIGATTAAPSPLVLAVFAAAALASGHPSPALAWAGLAGAAPLLAAVDEGVLATSAMAERLGFVGPQPRALAVATGLVAAAVLAVEGRRRADQGLVLLGAGAAALGTLVSWTSADTSGDVDALGMAGAFLLVQTTAYLTRHDPFWSHPTRVLARLGEALAAVSLPVLVAVTMLIGWSDEAQPALALAVAVAALGWLAGDLRRTGGRGRVLATFGMALSVPAAVALATTSVEATAVAVFAAAVAGGLVRDHLPAEPGVVSSWPGGHVIAVLGALYAPAMAFPEASWLGVGLAAAGAALVVEAAVRRTLAVPSDRPGVDRAEAWGWVLALVALAPGALSVGLFAEATDQLALALGLAAVAATTLAAQADRGRTTTAGMPLGTALRLSWVLVLSGSAGLAAREIGVVALVVAGCSVLDALRLRQPEVALGASVALPVAVAALARAAGLSLPSSGVALTVAAAVMAGLGVQLGGRWAVPVLGAVGLSIGLGLGLALPDPVALADALVVSGGIGLAAAVHERSWPGVYGAGAVVTGGLWLRLAEGGVSAPEPYLLPVCALLALAGARARRTGAGSWIAYGPAVGLLGGAALLERLAGGPGWHGLVAGTVAVAAVAAGGRWRLAAPLFLGTGLLVVLVGFETLAVTAGLPTWVWLALGGSALLGAGVAMGRHDLGPVETGRRLVDVVTERFD